jgi:hypothetical protein
MRASDEHKEGKLSRGPYQLFDVVGSVETRSTTQSNLSTLVSIGGV